MSKSLGERLLDATVSVSGDPGVKVPPDVMLMIERTAIIFAASLSHDETATATIEGLRGEVEAERRQKRAYLDEIDRQRDVVALLRVALTDIAAMPEYSDPVPFEYVSSLSKRYRRALQIAEAALNPQEARNAE